MINIKIYSRNGQKFPKYETEGSAGMDLRSSADGTIEPFERALVPTGLFMSIPKGYEGQIRPRSGLAYKYGITVLNSPGTIDSDYRGEIKVLLINLSDVTFTIKKGDRIAQMVIAPYVEPLDMIVDFVGPDDLDNTDRGDGGFGHTGTK